MITKDEKYYKFNDNFFFSIFGSIDQYEINFLLLTSIFVAFYVGINAIIATKVIYISFIGYILISFL